MKKYLSSFIHEDDGIETIEFIGLVAVAAVLIGVVITIGGRMKTTADTYSDELNTKLEELGTIENGGKAEG